MKNAAYWRGLATELQSLAPAVAGEDSYVISTLVQEITEAIITGELAPVSKVGYVSDNL